MRNKIHNLLITRYPFEAGAINELRRVSRRAFGMVRGVPIADGEGGVDTSKAAYGRALLVTIGHALKSMYADSREATQVPQASYQERYKAAVNSHGWVPTDNVAASLLGVLPVEVSRLRETMQSEYEFEICEAMDGKEELYRVTPRRNLAKEISDMLAKMPREDLAVLRELLGK